LEKLEARHLIDVLPDSNAVETPIGALPDRALAGVPMGFGNPINPVIVRLLKALADVGTLYGKERKIRVLPRQWKADCWCSKRSNGCNRKPILVSLEKAPYKLHLGTGQKCILLMFVVFNTTAKIIMKDDAVKTLLAAALGEHLP